MANVAPKAVSTMVQCALKNDFPTAALIHRKMARLFDALVLETSPSPVKYLMYRRGIIRSPEVRLPLVSVSEPTQKQLETFLPLLESI